MGIRKAVKNSAALFIFAGLVACSPLHQWPARSASQGPFVAIDEEFSITQPADEVSFRQDRKGELHFVDFVVSGLASRQDYSVEWALCAPQAQFHEYWDDFITTYLTRNFGDGHYALLRSEHGLFKGRYPLFRFAAVGKHNGGSGGSIYGTAIGFGTRSAVIYVLRGEQPRHASSFMELPGYANFERFVQSLECLKACGR